MGLPLLRNRHRYRHPRVSFCDLQISEQTLKNFAGLAEATSAALSIEESTLIGRSPVHDRGRAGGTNRFISKKLGGSVE